MIKGKLKKNAPVARSQGRPTLDEAEEIDRAIRAAALDVSIEHGEAATMNEIASAAGLSRKSVYARYPNKTELILASIRDLLENAQGVEYDPSGSAEERLLKYIQAALELINTPRTQSIRRLLMLNPTYIAELRAEMFTTIYKHFITSLKRLLIDAHKSGEFRVDDVESSALLIAKIIFSDGDMPDRGDHLWATPNNYKDRARFITRIIVRGLAPRTAEEGEGQ